MKIRAKSLLYNIICTYIYIASMALISKYLCRKMPLIVAIKRFNSSNMYIRLYNSYLFIHFYRLPSPKQLWCCSIYSFFGSSSIKWNGSRLHGVSIIYCRTKLKGNGWKRIKIECIFLINLEKFSDEKLILWVSHRDGNVRAHNHITSHKNRV